MLIVNGALQTVFITTIKFTYEKQFFRLTIEAGAYMEILENKEIDLEVLKLYVKFVYKTIKIGEVKLWIS